MNLLLGLAIYLIVWWLAFFVMLPYGAESAHEANEESVPGTERGAPRQHRLAFKALVAAAIAGVVWLFIAWAISVDLWNVRPNL
jgi:predicted secreted protein